MSFFCITNIAVDWKGAKFIWSNSLDLDNDIIFWYRKCDGGATPPTEGKHLLKKYVNVQLDVT